MPRGRPKGIATPTQLASLAKARRVRAKQLSYFPALPEGGFKALSTPARMAARKAAYAKFSKRKMSGANKQMPSIAYNPLASYINASGKKIRANRKAADKKASKKLNAAVNQVVAAVKKVKKAASEKQLAALAKARAARAAKRGGSYLAISAPPILTRAEMMV